MPGAAGTTAASSAQGIPASCPEGTSESQYLGGDDFNPATERSTDWTLDPAEGGWRVEQSGEAGDGWRLHADISPVRSTVRATSGWVTLPRVEKLQLAIRHKQGFGSPDVYGALRVLDVNGLLTAHGFQGDSDTTLKTINLTPWKGRSVRVELVLHTRDHVPGEGATGWDIDDISLHTCFDPIPRTSYIRSSGTYALNFYRAAVAWDHPAWVGSGLTGFTVTATRSGDSEPSQVHVLPPDRHNIRLEGLSGGTYRVEVTANSAAGSSKPAGTTFHGTIPSVRVPSEKRFIVYGQSASLPVQVTREDGSFFDGGRLLATSRPRNAELFRAEQSFANEGVSVPMSVRPEFTTEYRAEFEPWDDRNSELSSLGRSETLYVRPAVTAAFNSTAVAPGKIVHLRGRVAPAHAGSRVLLQRIIDGAWRSVKAGSLSSTSAYDFAIMHRTKRTYYYRVVIAAHTDHATGYSPRRYLRVR